MTSTSVRATRGGAWQALLVVVALTGSVVGERIVASDIADALPDVPCVDVNSALFHDLTKVHGLGKGMAKAIAAGRFCPFKDVSDFESRFSAHAQGGAARWGVLKGLLSSGSLCVGKPEGSACLEVNGASKFDFVKVEGIDEATAVAIVLSRTCPYADEADLQKRVEAQSKGKVFWTMLQALIAEKKLCVQGGGAAPAGTGTGDQPGEVAGTKDVPGSPGNVDDTKDEDLLGDVAGAKDVSGSAAGAADVGPHQQAATLSAAELGQEVDGSDIKVAGLPEHWNAKDEGLLAWRAATGELELDLKHKSSGDATVVSHRFFFAEGGLEFVDGTFTWKCKHWPHLVLTGRLASDGAKKVADVEGKVIKKQ